MNSHQDLTARNTAKSIVQSAIDERKPNIQKVTRILGNENPKDLFESKLTVELDKKNYMYESADFIYHKLNLHYLSWLGIELEFVTDKLIVSKTAPEIMYGEYYCDVKHSCIIFVKYSFKHVELHSDDGKTDLKTFAFVNTKCEIFYYDDYSGMKLLNSFHPNLNVSHAKKIFAKKMFKVEPMPSARTYQICTGVNSDTFKEESFDNIHLICIELMNILFESYDQTNIPSKSELKVETQFLGMTHNPVTVQSVVHISYSNDGKIEVTENLEQYEMTLYFASFPDKKVRARFYLTTAEKNQSFRLTKAHLENAVLTAPTECTIDTESLFRECDYVFDAKFVSCCEQYERGSESALISIGEFISKYVYLKDTSLKYPDLKDTFQKIYVEYFDVGAKKFPKEYEFSRLKLGFDNSKKHLSQVGYYSIKYNGVLYLVKIELDYCNHVYYSPSLTVYLPAFTACFNSISIFKPTSQEEVDGFLDENLGKKSVWRISEYINHDLYIKQRKKFTDIFPDFAIESNNSKAPQNFTINEKCNSTILKNVLESIQNLGTATTSFNFSHPLLWGADDDDDSKTVQYPIYSGNIIYGFNIQDESELMCINSSFQHFKPGEYSTGDNLLMLEFRSQAPSFKTTFHTLINKFPDYSPRPSGLQSEKYAIEKSELWKLCAKFLTENQNEIFSD